MNINLLDKNKLSNIKIKKKYTPKKKLTPLSKEYKVFLKKGISNNISENKSSNKINIVKVDNKNKNIKKNIVNIDKSKDKQKSKNKFTKRSQNKQNKRMSNRKKQHRKFSKVKKLSYKCNNNSVNLNDIIKETNNKSIKEIKEKLSKKGINIKSDNKKLLKDLYLFTSCGGINIIKE